MADRKIDQLEPGDREITTALGATFGETPTTDWGALESRITEAGRFRLAARRPPRWRTAASRWARIAVPAGLAASVLLGAVLAWRAADDEAVLLQDIVATAAVAELPPDVASVGGESLFYALIAEGE
ncbi:MAG TPA: hypothetical protein VFT04_09635 [Gemmatimonadales bacterium]|nr:hypothetical protein [Gemmatimonadales bacterium]